MEIKESKLPRIIEDIFWSSIIITSLLPIFLVPYQLIKNDVKTKENKPVIEYYDPNHPSSNYGNSVFANYKH